MKFAQWTPVVLPLAVPVPLVKVVPTDDWLLALAVARASRGVCEVDWALALALAKRPTIASWTVVGSALPIESAWICWTPMLLASKSSIISLICSIKLPEAVTTMDWVRRSATTTTDVWRFIRSL